MNHLDPSTGFWSADRPTPSVLAVVPTRNPNSLPTDVMGCLEASGKVAGCRVRTKISCGLYGVAPTRNAIVADFLKQSEFTHLFFVDDDVLVPPNAIRELLALASPVAAGCVPSIWKDRDGRILPYVQVQPVGVAAWLTCWPDRVPIPASVVGGGCMLIERATFSALEFPWFRWPERLVKGEHVSSSDDLDFCQRIKQAGLAITAAGSVRCQHRKTVDVGLLIQEAPDAVP